MKMRAFRAVALASGGAAGLGGMVLGIAVDVATSGMGTCVPGLKLFWLLSFEVCSGLANAGVDSCRPARRVFWLWYQVHAG